MPASFPSFEYELHYSNRGLVAGIDEAGRGALAGPLYVGCVVFPLSFYSDPPPEIAIINDSKKLSRLKRCRFLSIIQKQALFCDYEVSLPEEVDACNVNEATRLAVNRLLDRVPFSLQTALLDGNFRFESKHPLKSLKRGDSLSLSVAAASIVAKVKRDEYMCEIASSFPLYDFEKNVGYGTRLHCEAIKKHGPTIIHRKSYEPVRSML
ncbi:MAG: ribonuclease HII [Spirochaetes bacterium]|jgi:ribonuclease HII|nr:ribonuclease HII [Spirochaetota bacterium]